MKTLLILRHGKSSWSDPDLDDHDRPLKKRGWRDAPRMGRLLVEHGLALDLVISSTARRARETAQAVAEAAGYTGDVQLESDLYMVEPSAIRRRIAQVADDVQTLLIVGHNPCSEDLVQSLTGVAEIMPTAALAHVELPITSWADISAGRLVGVWRPKEL